MTTHPRPAVSIVIPTREEAAWIDGALTGFARHSRPEGEVELVVVDAGSTDGTAQLAADGADVVLQQVGPHRTIAEARDQGGRAARGALLFHTDTDVRIDDLDGFLRGVERRFADPEVVAIGVRLTPYPWEGDARDRWIHRQANALAGWSYRHGLYFARGECQIVRRDAFLAVGGYRAELSNGEDGDLFRRLAQVGRVEFCPELEVHHSMRRFRQEGYWHTLGVYLREGVWVHVTGRTRMTEWSVVR